MKKLLLLFVLALLISCIPKPEQAPSFEQEQPPIEQNPPPETAPQTPSPVPPLPQPTAPEPVQAPPAVIAKPALPQTQPETSKPITPPAVCEYVDAATVAKECVITGTLEMTGCTFTLKGEGTEITIGVTQPVDVIADYTAVLNSLKGTEFYELGQRSFRAEKNPIRYFVFVLNGKLVQLSAHNSLCTTDRLKRLAKTFLEKI
ncbi:hypothetical protein HY642_01485 [Candidatus Woesearchaeota archaeon]|nr:hypothetical protein [Candidatus Woesearchaeota archaeon]